MQELHSWSWHQVQPPRLQGVTLPSEVLCSKKLVLVLAAGFSCFRMSINTFRVRTRQAWQQFISEEKITELLAPPVRPIPKVIPGLHHRLSVLMLRLWNVTQLHYLYRALPFGCTDEAWNN